MNRIICTECGKQRDDPNKAGFCVDCGHLMKMPPLSDGVFENMDEDSVFEDEDQEEE